MDMLDTEQVVEMASLTSTGMEAGGAIGQSIVASDLRFSHDL